MITSTRSNVVFLRALRYWREQRALSQAELADKAGLTEQTVWNLENMKVQPRPSTTRKLARALGVEPSQLYGPPDEAQP